jgi:glyoxylase-like metal-dependent hydrolase (beta-lactamase superfamily II)
MKPGVLQTLKPGVHRLIAPNPSVMTGPGTNTYLIGERRLTVLDPGPDIAEHIEAIAREIRERGAELERIVVTHTHPDHSPGATLLAERFQVPVVGCAIANDGYQDDSFAPTHALQHDDSFEVDGSILRAIHTPGHVDNHYCFLHEASGTVFTGDHIMQGSTVVIIPPAGDMADYMDSLRRILDYPVAALAPGHGDLITDPHAEIQGLLAHRQRREDKIFGTLRAHRRGDLNSLVAHAYDDVDPAIHEIAKLSLWAHLLKFEKEGRADKDGEHWVLRD